MKFQETNDIEAKIREAIESETPNDFPAVLSACKSNTTRERVLKMKTNRISTITKIASIAAVFILTVCLCMGIYFYMNSTDAIISLDVNPGVEITLGRNQKVLKFEATNDDGELIVTDLNLKGKKLDEAVDLLMEKFVEEGYISAEANSVLVSVNAKKIKNTDEMSALITEKITSKLSESGVEASILTQVVSEHDEIKALAEEYNMSFGKARLIYELVSKDGRHTFEELASLTVHEISILLRENDLIPEDVKEEGKISDLALITKEDALAKALESVELTEEDVTDIKVEFDYFRGHGEKKGLLSYDVKFETAENEYKIDVDAKTGEIIKSRTEPVEEDEDDNEKPEESKKEKEDNKFKTEQRPNNLIGKEEAFKQAFDKEGLDAENFEDTDCDVELKDGKWQYELEFEDGDNKHKVVIDAVTGDVISNQKRPRA